MKLFSPENSFWMSRITSNTEIEETRRVNKITATVVFGMPSKNCSYNGICRIEPEENFGKDNRRAEGIATLYLNQKNLLLFKFKKSEIKERTTKRHFGSGYFIIIEEYSVPGFICNAFGERSINILQGIYPVREINGNYEILIDTYP